MEKYTVNIGYASYYYADVVVEAESVADACVKALLLEDVSWGGSSDDPGDTFVTAIAKGEHESVFQVPKEQCLEDEIPHSMTEAGLFMTDAAVLKRADELIESIALRFLEQLHQDIGWLAYRHWRRQTRSNLPPRGICYSHEYCDANETMLAAHQRVFGEKWDLDMQDETQCRVWSYAWDRAIELVRAGKGPQV